jgi:hypothetical protein
MIRSTTSALTEFLNDFRKDALSFFPDREYCTGRDNTFLVADVPERLMVSLHAEPLIFCKDLCIRSVLGHQD